MEEGRSLYEMLDLKYGWCRMVVAGFFPEKRIHGLPMPIHGSYKIPKYCKELFFQSGQNYRDYKPNGSVAWTINRLIRCDVDIVESGRTLKENGLVVLMRYAP